MRIANNKVHKVQEFLSKQVSVRKYYLHTQIGGNGWQITRGLNSSWYLHLDDPAVLTALILTHGDGIIHK